MNDPFLKPDFAYNRLLDEYNRHKSLVVAIDYDNTCFDYHSKGYKFPAIIELIKRCNNLGFKIVLFSGSAKDRYPEMLNYCKSIGIKVDGINEDVIDWHPDKTLDWSNSKIFYNILLDDRAGLTTAYMLLKRLIDYLDELK